MSKLISLSEDQSLPGVKRFAQSLNIAINEDKVQVSFNEVFQKASGTLITGEHISIGNLNRGHFVGANTIEQSDALKAEQDAMDAKTVKFLTAITPLIQEYIK